MHAAKSRISARIPVNVETASKLLAKNEEAWETLQPSRMAAALRREIQAGMREREAQGRPVSHSPSSTYAPAQFATDPQAEGISKAQFRVAMERLFATKKITLDVTGPPSRQRSRIVPADENSWSE